MVSDATPRTRALVPEHQGLRIGSELVRGLLGEIGSHCAIDAIVYEELQPFYQQLRLRPATAVALRNYEREAGRRRVHPPADQASSN